MKGGGGGGGVGGGGGYQSIYFKSFDFELINPRNYKPGIAFHQNLLYSVLQNYM